MLAPSAYLKFCDAAHCGRLLPIFRINITPLSQDILKMEVICYSERWYTPIALRGGITPKIPIRTCVNRKLIFTQFVLC
jgi:hypothetical protein